MIRAGQIALLAGFLLIPACIFAQISPQTSEDQFIEQRIENIVESLDNENIDFQSLFESLLYFAQNPLNINTASKDLLRDLPMVNEQQIADIIAHREEYGPMVSLYELRTIRSLDLPTIQQMLPFITVEGKVEDELPSVGKILKYGDQELTMRWQRTLEEQRGYSELEPGETASRYVGSPERVYARYRFRYAKRLSFGITAEKDPGEDFFGGTQEQGFDYYSAHLFYRGNGLVRKVALGDFQAQFGQGLTYWSGLAFGGKSTYATDVQITGSGIREYTSVNENLFLRGGAVTLGKGDWNFTAFYSDKQVDGSIAEPQDTSLTDADVTLVSSLLESGYHRTETEVEKKDAVRQQHLGGHLRYSENRFEIGLTAVGTRLDGQVQPQDRVYNRFRFSGDENHAIGVDYQYRLREFSFFGETTKDASGDVATVNGLTADLDPRFTLAVVHRSYPKEFQPLESVAFGESIPPQGENGVYIGGHFFLFKKLEGHIFYDQFEFPWLRYRTDAPSRGKDFFTQLQYKFDRSNELQFRYRHREKPVNLSQLEDEMIPPVGTQYKRNYRLTFMHRYSSTLQLRSRVELSDYYRDKQDNETGFLAYQDVIIRPKAGWWRLTLRYALFDTESYDARIYAYENDVLYAYSIPAYFGRGVRYYALFQVEAGRWFDIWLRYSLTRWNDRQVVSSGLNEIDGNTRSEVKLQVRLKF